MTIDETMSEQMKHFYAQQEDEIKNQLASLVERQILVIHKTQPEIDILPSKDGGIKANISQRIGLSVDTERYIRQLENDLDNLKRVALKAVEEIDNFYIKSTQENHIQSIDEDDHSLWFARVLLQLELDTLDGAKK